MLDNKTKACTKCGVEKSLAEFNKRAATKSGYRPECRECGKTREGELARHKREQSTGATHKKCSKCKESKPTTSFAIGNGPYGRQSQCKACNYDNGLQPKVKERKKAYSRELRTGFNDVDVGTSLKIQNYECGICHTNLRELESKHVHADHDHVTGEKRGFLCGPCNRALGLFNDSTILLRRAAEYLEKPPLRGVL
jgi:hypothetical protein